MAGDGINSMTCPLALLLISWLVPRCAADPIHQVEYQFKKMNSVSLVFPMAAVYWEITEFRRILATGVVDVCILDVVVVGLN